MKPMRWMLPLGGLFLASSLLPAQTLIQRWPNNDFSGFDSGPFYRQFSDVDGDGSPEIVFPRKNAAGQIELAVVSVARGQVLFTIPTGPDQGPLSPQELMTTQDLDGDGLRDIVNSVLETSPSLRLLVRARSGLDGTLLWQTDNNLIPQAGVTCPVGDVDMDGLEDIGSFSILNPDAVVLSGKDGSPIVLLTGSQKGFSSLRFAGDLDGDGVNDVINDTTDGPEFFSGRTGQLLFSEPLDAPTGALRQFTIGVGDVDGDGNDDWAEGWRGGLGVGNCKPSGIAVFTGIPARQLDFIPGRQTTADLLYSGPFFHFDLDRDGAEEIVFWGSRNGGVFCENGHDFSPYYVRVYSVGRKKVLLEWGFAHLNGFDALDEDWDGDGLPDLLAQDIVGAFGQGNLDLMVSAFSVRKHLTVSSGRISRSQGGNLDFSIDAGVRYAGRSAYLILSGGRVWPYFPVSYESPPGLKEGFALPFSLTHLAERSWTHRGTGGWQKLKATLDAQGKALVPLSFAPNALAPRWVGRKILVTAILDSEVPGKPEKTTEAISVRVDP